jgi:uncharacterized membrane protein YbhN (UPF0104 family)
VTDKTETRTTTAAEPERLPPSAPARKGPSVGSFVKLAVSLGLLAFILNRLGWEQTRQALVEADVRWLWAALVVAVMNMAVRAQRWKLLLDALDVRLSLTRLTYLYLVGAFFSTFLPTSVGGDVVRAYEVAQLCERPAAAVGSVLLDRACGLLMLFAMALAALALGGSHAGPTITAILLLLALVGWGGLALLLHEDLLERLGILRLLGRFRPVSEVYEAIEAIGRRAIAGALGVSVAMNLLLISMNVCIGQALGVRIALGYYFLFVPIVAALLIVPVSLRGLGLREGAYVYLFAQAGVSSYLALTMGLLVYAAETATSLLGGLLYAAHNLLELRSADRA